MKEPKHISEILKDYFQNSQEPFAVEFRKRFNCPDCPNSPQNLTDETPLEDWIDSQIVMQSLHISPRTLQTLRTNGTLPYSRIGRKLYYKRSDIQRMSAIITKTVHKNCRQFPTFSKPENSSPQISIIAHFREHSST